MNGILHMISIRNALIISNRSIGFISLAKCLIKTEHRPKMTGASSHIGSAMRFVYYVVYYVVCLYVLYSLLIKEPSGPPGANIHNSRPARGALRYTEAAWPPALPLQLHRHP